MAFVIFAGPSPPRVPDFWNINTFNFLITPVCCFTGVFVGRMTKFVVELGNPEILREEEKELVNEKV